MRSNTRSKRIRLAAGLGMALAATGGGLYALERAGEDPPAADGEAANAPAVTARDGVPLPPAIAAPVRALQQHARGVVAVHLDRSTGVTSMLRVGPGGDLDPRPAASPETKVAAFLASHGAAFGVRDPDSELALQQVREDQYGNSRVRYQQTHEGVPVVGGVLHGHVSADGRLTAVNGKLVPALGLSSTPAITSAAASATAVARVQQQQRSARKTAPLEAVASELVVYRTGLTQGVTGTSHLAFEVEVVGGADVRERVYVDATNGKIVDQITGIHGAKNRRVYEASYDPASPELPPPAWREGDLRPAPNPAHEDEIAGAGHAYNLFYNLSGGTYRSWDGEDAAMITVNNDPTIVCPNANWNGTSTNYCSFTSADDVVVHEWTHAYTQETSGLIYAWQSGALNESYSDIFGETVDQLNRRETIAGATPLTGTNGPRSQDDRVCSTFDQEVPTADGSIRWLIGEDATAFSPLPPIGDAAIRDMWRPRCSGGNLFLGDPGHASSQRYSCSADDAGGVHTNSAVNNRAYALLVDGDTVELRDDNTPFANPVTVTGIGLTKAAHIFWRANSVYNTPASNFDDNANALEAACGDLVGVELTKLVSASESGNGSGPTNDTIQPTPELSGEVITAADCAQVANAIAAVEMRHDVSKQCNFKPLLDPAPAPLCSGATKTAALTVDWESGVPSGWTTGQQPATKPTLETRPFFLRTGDLPANPDGSVRPGNAMFQENRRDLGNCTTDDESGVLFMTSPAIQLDASSPSHLVFEHYVATEGGYDGGNVMISIDGGPFELIPASAFTHNAYPGTLATTADQNTNPKAGQAAFSGTNPNEQAGDWGESQIDLRTAGAAPGSTIQLRWDFGQDGCNGNEGWYIDRVEVFSCSGSPPPPPTNQQCTAYPAEVAAPGSLILSLVGSSTKATVSGATGPVTDVNVRNLEGTHTYMGDLTFTLQSPSGTQVTLFDGASCAGEDGIDAAFDDEADAIIGCADWLSGAAFKPFEAMAAFDGEDPNGAWTLTISDGFPQDDGMLESWSIELCRDLPPPAQPGDRTNGSGWVADSAGKKLNFHFDVQQPETGGPTGTLELNDQGTKHKVQLTAVTSFGGVLGACGPIAAGANTMEVRGTGTFDGVPGASFRACVEDNGPKGNSRLSATPDRFHLECTSGCTYSTAARAADAGLDGGNLTVTRAAQPAPTTPAPSAAASMITLDPILLSEAPVGVAQVFAVQVFGANQQPLASQPVTLTSVASDGTRRTLQAVSGPTGKAVFEVTIATRETEYIVTSGEMDSNAIRVRPLLP